MNLLPDDAKQNLRSERFSRFFIVLGAVLSAILLVGWVLLLVSWLALAFEERGLEKQLEIVRQSPFLVRINEIESELAFFNEKLSAYDKNRESILFTSRIFDRVLGHRQHGISLSLFSYNGAGAVENMPQFKIEGTASDREILVAFRDILDADPFIGNVRSPISNFLQERDISFSLTFDVEISLLRFTDIQ